MLADVAEEVAEEVVVGGEVVFGAFGDEEYALGNGFDLGGAGGSGGECFFVGVRVEG